MKYQSIIHSTPYHTIPTFHNLQRRSLWKTLREKEKMLFSESTYQDQTKHNEQFDL